MRQLRTAVLNYQTTWEEAWWILWACQTSISLAWTCFCHNYTTAIKKHRGGRVLKQRLRKFKRCGWDDIYRWHYAFKFVHQNAEWTDDSCSVLRGLAAEEFNQHDSHREYNAAKPTQELFFFFKKAKNYDLVKYARWTRIQLKTFAVF